MSRESKGAVSKRKYGFWIIFLGMLITATATGPDLWAAPGQRAGRNQTIPSGTLTPTPRPPATNPPPQPTSQATFTPIPTEQVATPTPSPDTTAPPTTPSATLISQATATLTAVPTETPTPVAEEATPTSTPTTPPVEEPLSSPSSTPTMPVESSGDIGGGSAVLCGGAGLVIIGMILLSVWRLRA